MRDWTGNTKTYRLPQWINNWIYVLGTSVAIESLSCHDGMNANKRGTSHLSDTFTKVRISSKNNPMDCASKE